MTRFTTIASTIAPGLGLAIAISASVSACSSEPTGDDDAGIAPGDAALGEGDALPAADAGVDCSMAPNGTTCGTLQICLDGSCEPSSCGDGFVDEDGGEQCEDGNIIAGDGCEPNCLFTCTSDAGCNDQDVCTGQEVCLLDHTCSDPDDLGCDDNNPCTADTCDALTGCRFTLIDNDGDGVAPVSVGNCSGGTAGGDCNDNDPTVYPGAYDGCDGQGIDNDCDGTADEDGTGQWYADCDADGYPPAGAQPVDSCDQPSTGPASCSDGNWVAAAPTGQNTDCDDANSQVNPGATELIGNGRDDDCDGMEICYRDHDDDGHRTEQTVTTSNQDCTADGLAPASAPLEWKFSSKADDCYDQDPAANQSQTAYFSFSDDPNGIEACPGGLRWDYNADGEQTKRWNSAVNQCFWEPAGCSRGGDPDTEGFFTSGAIPACGSIAVPWAHDCEQNGLTSCSFSFATREQACR